MFIFVNYKQELQILHNYYIHYLKELFKQLKIFQENMINYHNIKVNGV